ncbi:LAC2-like protein [Mya arenaria]|uniref:LAC2-like protein n=1 Tax=Mya arenaria TaxID=6604 RepID=A0ABY7EWE1_MYAAR|nr:LAC2-like protein [Mya arenaria]
MFTVWMIAFATVFAGTIFHTSTGLAEYHHPCNRECVLNGPMVCEYNFTVENFYTMSRVCQGDTVRVWVTNLMDDGSSTSIHWHGLEQRGTNFMDGAARVTQCDIGPHETFRYEFTADNAGTHWWHSHTGVQLGDGLYGAFIVREPPSSDSRYSMYDKDLSGHVMLINDWPDKPQIYRYMEEMQDRWMHPYLGINVLLNGRGRKHLVDGDPGALGLTMNPNATYTPYETFNVNNGQRYRFRAIGAATRCYFRVSIQDHVITVVTSDGNPVTPSTVDSFMIHPGERYDFILHADQISGDYWVRVQAFGDCRWGGGHGSAILHYQDCDLCEDEPQTLPEGEEFDHELKGTILNPDSEFFYDGQHETHEYIEQKTLRYDHRDFWKNETYHDERVDVRYYMNLRYQANDNSMYSHPDYYPQESRYGLITPTINNLTLYRPTLPLATQWEDVTHKRLCNASTVDTVNDCNDDLCYCTHMLDVEMGQVVEFFIYGQANDPHQMHLHGYTFRVVGDGHVTNNWNDNKAFNSVTMQEVIERDRNGEFPRILTNPIYKDTITVHSKGGYSIIRFKADNPGVWFFHCHNEGHLMQGMALLVKVGRPVHTMDGAKQFPHPPNYFPVCGKTVGHLNKIKQCDVSGASALVVQMSTVILVAVYSLLLL